MILIRITLENTKKLLERTVGSQVIMKMKISGAYWCSQYSLPSISSFPSSRKLKASHGWSHVTVPVQWAASSNEVFLEHLMTRRRHSRFLYSFWHGGWPHSRWIVTLSTWTPKVLWWAPPLVDPQYILLNSKWNCYLRPQIFGVVCYLNIIQYSNWYI